MWYYVKYKYMYENMIHMGMQRQSIQPLHFYYTICKLD